MIQDRKKVQVELVFVYNVDSSLFAEMSGLARRAVTPSSYPCNLCKITYTALGMKNEWKQFLESLDIPAVFYHRDEFHERFPRYGDIDLPSILIRKDSVLSVLVSNDTINRQHSITDLKSTVRARLKNVI